MTRTLIIRLFGCRLEYTVTADSLRTIRKYAESLVCDGYKVSVKGAKL